MTAAEIAELRRDADRWRALRPFLVVEVDGDSEGSWVDLHLLDSNTGAEFIELSPAAGRDTPERFVDALIEHPDARVGYSVTPL